jgi:hypothetical protein
MTRQRYGMLAGIVSAAFAAWWMRRPDYIVRKMSESGREEMGRNSPATAP